MVQLFHQELARITPVDAVPCTGAAAIKRLSPRLRQTLDLLGTGLAEKQVAAELGCSCNTVHGYVKELHRRFAVSTRSELLVRLYETRGLAQA
jgi:DNA-binding NarL/FixJ family response regulator